MRTFTICILTEEINGPVAEMLFTRLSRAYYFAGGFSTAQAGASMKSIKMESHTQQEREKTWEEYQTWVKDPRHTDYMITQATELSRRKQHREEAYMEKINAVKARLETKNSRRQKIKEAYHALREVMQDSEFDEIKNLPDFPDKSDAMARMKAMLDRTRRQDE
jgi:hypothetical protein